jgi:hypothetical protein
MLDGYDDKQHATMQRTAWLASHILIAAGAKPDAVTPGKLLGDEKEPTLKQRLAQDERNMKREKKRRDAMWAKVQEKRAGVGNE